MNSILGHTQDDVSIKPIVNHLGETSLLIRAAEDPARNNSHEYGIFMSFFRKLMLKSQGQRIGFSIDTFEHEALSMPIASLPPSIRELVDMQLLGSGEIDYTQLPASVKCKVNGFVLNTVHLGEAVPENGQNQTTEPEVEDLAS